MGRRRTRAPSLAISTLVQRSSLFADTFLLLQEERHTADYDPTSRYTREKTLELIERAELAVQLLHAAPRADRRTLAVLAMFRKR